MNPININAVTTIIGITVLVSLAGFSNRELLYKLMMNPYSIRHHNQWYRFFTSGFIHIDFIHLFFNMYVFYSFGVYVLYKYISVFHEKGIYYFIMLYVGGIVFSDMPSYLRHQSNPRYNSLGASGAVSAVLFAAVFLSPLTKVSLMFLPFPMYGFVFAILYVLFEWYMGRRGGDNINHDAHIFGAIYGVVFTFIMKPPLLIEFIADIRSLIS